jgi:hypothetical protein
MANGFTKEERLAWEDMLEGFNDAEVMARNVNKYTIGSEKAERSGDRIWRNRPYIMPSYSGTDMTGNFTDKVQLAVPASINISRSSPWSMTATELRDAMQEKNLGKSAYQKLGSDINSSVLDIVANQGSLVVPITDAASGFDDVALCEAIMNEAGVPNYDRVLALSTRDYNSMAGDLAKRETVAGMVKEAYKRAYVGPIASFETFKLDLSKRIAAAAGGAITISTADASNFQTPVATTTNAINGGESNVDNRFATVTVSSTTDVAVGDAFTIADVNAVHHITKEDTGQLKTFRVVSVDTDTTMTITPPLVDPNVGAGEASETQYQNCVVNTESATAAITWLNLSAAAINPFWQKEAIEIIPGSYAVPSDAGVAVLRGKTDSGIELVLQKQYDITTMATYFRVDTLYGVVNKDPEQSGIMIFNQS